jgi:hypothetical protein
VDVTDANDSGASLLDLGDGFLALPRRLCGSSLFRSLRPDERWVVVEMLLAARYADGGEFWFAGQRIPLAPGQFIDSEEQIATAAGSTRKVVRNVAGKLITAGVITRRRAHPSGRCPFVTTFTDYDRIRFAGGEAGPRSGQRGGPYRADERAHEGAPSEQGGTRVKPGNPHAPSPSVRSPEGGAGAPRRSAAAPSSYTGNERAREGVIGE